MGKVSNKKVTVQMFRKKMMSLWDFLYLCTIKDNHIKECKDY